MSFQTQIVELAFQDLGVVQSGETPSAAEMATALLKANQILVEWGTEELMNPTPGHGQFAITAGVFIYAMGLGAIWATALRPIRIKGARAYTGNLVRGLKCSPMDQFHEEQQSPFGETAMLPAALGWDNFATQINVELFPMPNTTSVINVDYWAAAPFTPFATLGDAVSLAQGLEPALQKALAVALYPQFPRLSAASLQSLASLAQNAKASVVAMNAASMGMSQNQLPETK